MLDRFLWRCVGGRIVFGVRIYVRLGLGVNCVEFYRLPDVKILLEFRTEILLLPCFFKFFLLKCF